MPDLQVLNSLIAVVVVLLVLSLIVQSLQGALKKLLKIKSRQIEDSLIDLFENALNAPSAHTQGMLASSPVMRLVLFRKPPVHQADPRVQTLFRAVAAKFGEVGRVAQSGRFVLDSLAKEDLLKVLAQVAPGTLLPGMVEKLEDAFRQVLALEQALAGISSAGLSGESAARLASLRQTIAPMVNDVKALYAGQALAPGVLVGDVVRMREVQLDDLLGAIADLQKEVDQEIAAAKQAGQPTAVLDAASQGLTKVADGLADLAAKFDAAVAPLRTRLRSVETWYDTVMQSFEERYNRGMRTWCFVLSLLVVVVADANFFRVLQSILQNDVQRARLVEAGAALLPPPAAAPAAAPGSTEVSAAAPESTVTGAVSPDQPAATPAATEPAATEPAEPGQDGETVQQIVGEARQQAKTQFDLYTDLGFKPLTMTTLRRDFASLGAAVFTLSGWLIMTLLLSVGAPFWQDALESLFGVKNLLRKRGDIQLVEQKSGQGYPRAA
jgi:hypothetical protein